MREEIIGDCRIILGDMLEILPGLDPVCACVCDPPYGLTDWNNRGSNSGGPFDSEETQGWDQPITKEQIDLIFKKSKHQILWGGNHYLHLLRQTKQMFVWNKGIRGMHFNDCEIAWCSQFREACRVFDFSPSGILKEHPTQKPLQLMEWCIKQLPKETETILDPYMGSASTGIACLKTGKKFIGIEKNPKYFDVACKRVSEFLRQPDFFIPQPQKIKQESFI